MGREACDLAAVQSVRFIILTTFQHIPWSAPFCAKRGLLPVTDPSAFPQLAGALRHETGIRLGRRIGMVKNAAQAHGQRTRDACLIGSHPTGRRVGYLKR